MCRNLKTLFNFDPPATKEEIQIASLQFVRKISGFNKPSKVNEEIFNSTINKVSKLVTQLLEGMTTKARPKNRENEAAKNKIRFKKRLDRMRNQ